jgi:ankyrin
VVRILAKEFPHYFAVITRTRQDVQVIGPEGGLLTSSRLNKAQVNIRPK